MAKLTLIPAKFVRRPNRFVVEAQLKSGDFVPTHLADPGRLRELLIPGAELRLRPVPEDNPRKTRYTVALVRSSDPPYRWVSVDTSLPNRLARELLLENRVPGLPECAGLRREVTHGKSRFDFLVAHDDGAETWVEVKSVTLVEDGVARFPDAPTVRGARHVRELTEIVQAGGQAAVLFVVQRDDAILVEPKVETDPDFAEALRQAQTTGVRLHAVRYRLHEDGSAEYRGILPVHC
jgi:sugar fermentation stimulation protein A